MSPARSARTHAAEPSFLDALAPGRGPDRPADAHDRALRHRRDRRPAAGRAVHQRGVRRPDRAEERPQRRPRSARPTIGGVSSAMGAIFILLAVGALIGTWNMAGTIPTVVVLRHRACCGRRSSTPPSRSSARSSAWSPAARGPRPGRSAWRSSAMAPILGMSTTHRRRRRSSPGAYMGDKMSPLSETTILVPSLVGGVTTSTSTSGACCGRSSRRSCSPFVDLPRHRATVDAAEHGDRHRRRPATCSPTRSTSRPSTCCRWCC